MNYQQIASEIVATRLQTSLAPRLQELETRMTRLLAQREALSQLPPLTEPATGQASGAGPEPEQGWNPGAEEMLKMFQEGRQDEVFARLRALEQQG